MVRVRFLLFFFLSFLRLIFLPLSDELRRLDVPLFCPWDTSPFEQKEFGLYGFKDYIYPTPIVYAFAACSKTYICWLLRHGHASVTDKISQHHNVLQAVMRSRSLALISFFFKGPHSHEDGAAFLPPEYRVDGVSEVLRLFFEANARGPAITDILFSRVRLEQEGQENPLNPDEELRDESGTIDDIEADPV